MVKIGTCLKTQYQMDKDIREYVSSTTNGGMLSECVIYTLTKKDMKKYLSKYNIVSHHTLK